MLKPKSNSKDKTVKPDKTKNINLEAPQAKNPVTAKAPVKKAIIEATNKPILQNNSPKKNDITKDALIMAKLPSNFKITKVADLSAIFRASITNTQVSIADVSVPRSKEDVIRANYSGLATGVTSMSPSTNMISFGTLDDERWWDSKTLVDKPDDFIFDAAVTTINETKLIISRTWSASRNRKTFYVKNMNGSVQNLDDVDKSIINLFFIDEALENTGSPIILCEGYRAALHLRRLNFNAIGTIDGGTLPAAAVLQRLKGRKVLLWPDNDEIGLKHMSRIFKSLQLLGADADHVIRWKGGPKNGDAADVTDIVNIKKLIDEAKPWPPALLEKVNQPAQIKRVGQQLKLRTNSIIARGGR